MASVHLHLPSFNSGELSETMAERYDVEKVSTGCEKLRNFLPHVHGPVEKRPGMEFLGYADSETDGPRLLEFNFSATTRFCIEFAIGFLQFWSNGAIVPTLAAVAHPYTPTETFELQAKQVNDVVYLVHPSHPPQKLTRRADDDWTLEALDLKFPVFLDEYVEPETVATPTVTTLHSQEMRHAPEWTVTGGDIEAIRWADIEPSGVMDSAWFRLDWHPGLAPVATGTLSLEIVNTDEDWVTGAAVTLSATSTAASPTEWCFNPSGTSVIIRKRTYTGSWSAWSTAATIVNVVDSGTTAATMPTIRIRFVPGADSRPMNTNLHRADITASVGGSGPLLDEYSRYYELEISGGTFTLNPIPEEASRPFRIDWPTAAGVKATLQLWNGTAWVALESVNLASPPVFPAFERYLYRVGSTVYYAKRDGSAAAALVTTTSNEPQPWRLRILTNQISDAVPVLWERYMHGNLPMIDEWVEIPLPAISRTSSADGDTGTGGVTVPVGKWVFHAGVTDPSAVPSGSSLKLQRLASGVWTNVKTWALDTSTSRYEFLQLDDSEEITTPTLYRALFASTSTIGVDGSAVFEHWEYPVSTATKVSVSETAGTGRTMTASAALFQAGHVGSYWQIVHRRDSAMTELMGRVGKFSATKLLSDVVRVVGRWDFTSYGTWKGKVYLERRTSSGVWEILRVWSSNKDRNIVQTGEVDTDSDLRIRAESSMVGYAASGVDVPRFLLECADSRSYGVVKVTGYTSSTEVTVDVVRVVGSTAETTMWSEGAFSGVRGYPGAVAVHEGRLWFGGTAHQPSMLWASGSNDYESFRRSLTDDASFAVAIAAESANSIRWLSSSADSLFIGTGGEEWSIRSNVEGQPLTPTNVKAVRRGAYSSSGIPARLVQDATIFVQRDGRRLRQTIADNVSGQFSAADLTALAPHVSASGFRQLAVAQSPQVIIWAVTNDGRLVSMTFEKEQNVFGWALHETNGTVISAAVLMGVASDELWVSVERNGRACIERLILRTSESIAEGWQLFPFVDSATIRNGAPSTDVTIPAHLVGEELIGLADGVPFTATPASGTLVLASAASRVVVGLSYAASLVPMHRDVPLQDGTSRGRMMRISRIGASLVNAGPCNVADAEDGLLEPMPISGAGLHSGYFETAVTSSARPTIKPMLRDESALPLTVQSMVMKMDIYGE